ncbi:hypothetical protein HanXRQr2_Chr06g0244941 [Helianthus annuus]|uniref:Uncharacterized protein n=1 Tax=Helianthus annuus TaxID=4232 RepID=A0A9K3IQN6_HELAN|nr:hypothetical protein HanXRQr2_Chr06g0244941 [Helianthus annuus]
MNDSTHHNKAVVDRRCYSGRCRQWRCGGGQRVAEMTEKGDEAGGGRRVGGRKAEGGGDAWMVPSEIGVKDGGAGGGDVRVPVGR